MNILETETKLSSEITSLKSEYQECKLKTNMNIDQLKNFAEELKQVDRIYNQRLRESILQIPNNSISLIDNPIKASPN